jgi:hypothetical protein
MRQPHAIWQCSCFFLLAVATNTARADIVFEPGNPFGTPGTVPAPEIVTIGGQTMSQPITASGPLSNPNVLSNVKVYLIFVGANWVKDGTPTSDVTNVVNGATTLLDSAFYFGLTQYGSNGHVSFAGYTVDGSFDPADPASCPVPCKPVTIEVNKILNNPDAPFGAGGTATDGSKYTTWLPPDKSLVHSPIYVAIRYNPAGGSTFGGQNWPQKLTVPATAPATAPAQYVVNVADIGAGDTSYTDKYMWSLSHETAERIGSSELITSEGQICDGEPERGEYLDWPLSESGPLVTSYWSMMDQAYLITNGDPHHLFLTPMWAFDGSGKASPLKQLLSNDEGVLLSFPYADIAPTIPTDIDSHVAEYRIDSSGAVYYTKRDGTVWSWDGNATDLPTEIAGPQFVASAIVAPASYGYDVYGTLPPGPYIIASKDGGDSRVFQYDAASGTWTAVTPPGFTVDRLRTWWGNVYIKGSASGETLSRVYQYTGSGTIWSPVTDGSTSVSNLISVGANLYIGATVGNGNPRVYQYQFVLTPITAADANKSGFMLVDSGNTLMLVGTNGTATSGVWEYGLTPNAWTLLTPPNMTVYGNAIVENGLRTYIVADDGHGKQVFEYRLAANGWLSLTDPTVFKAITKLWTDGENVFMTAVKGSGSLQTWVFGDEPNMWTLSP